MGFTGFGVYRVFKVYRVARAAPKDACWGLCSLSEKESRLVLPVKRSR